MLIQTHTHSHTNTQTHKQTNALLTPRRSAGSVTHHRLHWRNNEYRDTGISHKSGRRSLKKATRHSSRAAPAIVWGALSLQANWTLTKKKNNGAFPVCWRFMRRRSDLHKFHANSKRGLIFVCLYVLRGDFIVFLFSLVDLVFFIFLSSFMRRKIDLHEFNANTNEAFLLFAYPLWLFHCLSVFSRWSHFYQIFFLSFLLLWGDEAASTDSTQIQTRTFFLLFVCIFFVSILIAFCFLSLVPFLSDFLPFLSSFHLVFVVLPFCIHLKTRLCLFSCFLSFFFVKFFFTFLSSVARLTGWCANLHFCDSQ